MRCGQRSILHQYQWHLGLEAVALVQSAHHALRATAEVVLHKVHIQASDLVHVL